MSAGAADGLRPSAATLLAATGPLSDLDARVRRRLLDRRSPDDDGAEAAAGARAHDAVRDAVREIVERVRAEGDRALHALARELDGVDLQDLEVPRDLWEAAADDVGEDVRRALERAALNIEVFHAAQLPAPIECEPEPGVTLTRRWTPVERAGVYAPGGRAAYPSSVLMGVVPARVCGVERVVVCSPPGPDGRPSAPVLAAAYIGGADKVLAVGGAGAIGALTYGTESVPAVDVIVGPGNRYVTEAKRQVAGVVRIDGPAGPSEILMLIDESADPERVALELVAQAEHDPDAAAGVLCVCEDPAAARALAGGVESALAEAAAGADRRDVVTSALAARGFVLWTDDVDGAVDFANAYAAEHLALVTVDAEALADRMVTAGTIFIGPTSSVAFGDYLTGANHVLPTEGRARSFSGLSVEAFLRSHTVQRVSERGAAALVDPTTILAEAEGLPGHAAAARAAARGGSR